MKQLASLILPLAAASLQACAPSPAKASSAAAAPAAAPAPAPTPVKHATMICRNSQDGRNVACGTPNAVMVGIKEN